MTNIITIVQNALQNILVNPQYILSTMLIYYESLKKINKYKLTKQNTYAKSMIINKTPKAIISSKKAITPPLEIEPYLKTFKEHLKDYLTQDKQDKLSSIAFQINFLNSLKQKLITHTGGYYDSKTNKLAINKLTKKDYLEKIIYHELLHAITMIETPNTYFCGFSQASKDNKVIIGTGINEGYTDYLANKMSNFDIDANPNIGYPYQISVVRLLEFIIGEDKIKKLYLNSDLKGLIEELSKYQNPNEVKNFIINLDTITKMRRQKPLEDKERQIKNYENQINIFLYNLYTNKNQSIYNVETSKEYIQNQETFLSLYDQIDKCKYKEKNIIQKTLIKNKKGFTSITWIITITMLLIIILLILKQSIFK